MPYIRPAERRDLDPLIAAFTGKLHSAGTLNYAITKLVQIAIETDGGLNYALIAGVTGVLENVKQEFYRRVAAPYEDTKRAENGDVY